MNPLVIYHANCTDGFGAAWAAWCSLGNEATYLPVNYGDPVPLDDAIDRDVYVLDFSWSRPLMEKLAVVSKSLVVLDHHSSARDQLEGLPYATFDLGKSGAVLSWEHFHKKPVPILLRYVEDRDLWKFSLAKSREVSYALRSVPLDFKIWSELTIESLCRDGEAIVGFVDQQVANMAQNAVDRVLDSRVVPVVNVSMLYSEVGEYLAQRHPSGMGVYYFDRADGRRQWGLRSRGNVECLSIAQVYGGGGHKQASGFETEIGWLPPERLDL